jgi:putative peptide zinc metalloprotease protein
MKLETANKIPVLSEHIRFTELTDTEFILSNTQNKHYLKINIDVYRLLKLIDGVRNLDEIEKMYESQYNKQIPAEYIDQLLTENLSQYGLLKGYDDKIKPVSKPDYLKLSFIIFNKNLVSKVVGYFSPLFKKKIFLFFLPVLFAVSISILLKNIDLYRSFDVRTVMMLFFIIEFVSVTFHEIGHASAAHYFGAEHGGIGGGFYLFRPVYYADVTDIWKLKKNERIIVNLSGIYFELIFCCGLLLIGYFLNWYILTATAFFVMISALFNLNPFMRSDGYWVLSDLTDTPNLASRSRKKVQQFFFDLFQKKKINRKCTDIYLIIYGSVRISFLTLFLYYTLIKNPASILYFPINLYHFIRNIFDGTSFSLYDFRKLIIPLIFYYMLYHFLLSLVRKYGKKGKNRLQKNFVAFLLPVCYCISI